jgi:FkbM family methyltransferase
LVERWGHLLGESAPLRCRLVNGDILDCDPADHVQRHIVYFGLYEPVESWLTQQLLRPGMSVVDVGANLGQYTLLASTAVAPTGHVWAFEPVAVNFERLSASVRHNARSNVTLRREALWDRRASLAISPPPPASGVNCGAFSVSEGGPDGAETTAAASLDELAAAIGITRVDFVKMDVEGAELRALLGMRSLLRRDRPWLLLEVCRATLSRLGATPEMLWDLLHGELHYDGWLIAADADRCHPLENLSGIEQSNVLFHCTPLPDVLTRGWRLRDVLRWARGRQT